MRPPKSLPQNASENLVKALKKSKSKSEYRRVLCLWLRASLGLSAEQIAAGLDLSISSVWRIQSNYLRYGEGALLSPGSGGRHHENISIEKETAFIQQFLHEASTGGILEVSKIKVAYEKMVKHTVPKSTIYRLLARHGWRKIIPKPRHPKADLHKQESFKKTSL